MARYFLRRLAVLPVLLLATNFLAYTYTLIAQVANSNANPFFTTGSDIPYVERYVAYLQNLARLDFGQLPGQSGTVIQVVTGTLGASLVLLIPALILSVIAGIGLGVSAVRIGSSRIAGWLMLSTTVGISMPAFYLGVLLISTVLIVRTPVLPVNGYGIDAHLILPVVVLMIRPTFQSAQVTAGLMASEASKRYVVAAQSLGYSTRALYWRHMLRNVLGAITLYVATSFRLLMVELLVVERLFNWPGLGRLFAMTLVAPKLSDQYQSQPFFLHPALLTFLVGLTVCLFLGVDLITNMAAMIFDPRLRVSR